LELFVANIFDKDIVLLPQNQKRQVLWVRHVQRFQRGSVRPDNSAGRSIQGEAKLLIQMQEKIQRFLTLFCLI
jgi:hypothetical protein